MKKILNLLFVCHQLPERSFFYKGRQLPLCARCTGILLGYMLGIVYAALFGAMGLWAAMLLTLPFIIDGSGQYYGKWESTNGRRFVTGLFGGIGIDFVIYGMSLLGLQHGKLAAEWVLFVI